MTVSAGDTLQDLLEDLSSPYWQYPAFGIVPTDWGVSFESEHEASGWIKFENDEVLNIDIRKADH